MNEFIRWISLDLPRRLTCVGLVMNPDRRRTRLGYSDYTYSYALGDGYSCILCTKNGMNKDIRLTNKTRI